MALIRLVCSRALLRNTRASPHAHINSGIRSIPSYIAPARGAPTVRLREQPNLITNG